MMNNIYFILLQIKEHNDEATILFVNNVIFYFMQQYKSVSYFKELKGAEEADDEENEIEFEDSDLVECQNKFSKFIEKNDAFNSPLNDLMKTVNN